MENQINLEQNPTSQPAPIPEKPKVNYWMILSVILGTILIVVSIFTLSSRGKNESINGKQEQKINLSETPVSSDSSINSNLQLQDDEVFLVTTVDRLKYNVRLYNRNTKELKEKTIDFGTTGTDIGFLTSRFAGVGGTEYVQYNPVTGEIILVVAPLPGGEGGNKSSTALPDPNFSYAIYKTTFNEKEGLTQLFNSKEQAPRNVVLNSDRNVLAYTTRTYKDARITSEDIFEFDLKNKLTRKITSIQTASDNKEIVELSDLNMSSQTNKIYQLVLYGTQGFWMNQRLELKIIDANSGNIETKTIVTGDDIKFSITGLSQDAQRVAFYTMVNNETKLQFKNLSNNTLIPIFPSEDIKNGNLFISGNKNQILYGTDNGWTLFDVDTQKTYKTTITRPFTWSPFNDYIVGAEGEKFVIYDTLKSTISDTRIKLREADMNSIEAVQWK